MRHDTVTLRGPRSRTVLPAMVPPDIERLLDNPVWSCLTTRHAHLAFGGATARRYPAAISPITGFPDDRYADIGALESLVDVGDDMGAVGPRVPELPSNWEALFEAAVTEMIRQSIDRRMEPSLEYRKSVDCYQPSSYHLHVNEDAHTDS